jgi:hypothetical protein
MCCGRDGGGGALVSGLWKEASCRGWQGLTGLSSGRGMLSRYTFDHWWNWEDLTPVDDLIPAFGNSQL